MTDTQKALNALGWLGVCLDMSHTEWCDSAAWRDDFAEKIKTIRAALEAKAVDVPDHTELLREAAMDLLDGLEHLSTRNPTGRPIAESAISAIRRGLSKINTALGKETP